MFPRLLTCLAGAALCLSAAEPFRFAGFSLHGRDLPPADGRNHVFALKTQVDGGVIKRMRLSLEDPGSGSARDALSDMESRHPACGPILADLTKRYGKPKGPELSSEERLESRRYVWRGVTESMALVCGHYTGRTRVFAMEVEMYTSGLEASR